MATAEVVRSLGEAERALRRALARVEWQVAQLERAAATRERAARRVLPGDEAAARRYLAQRYLLLEGSAGLRRRAGILRDDLAALARLRFRVSASAAGRPATDMRSLPRA